MRRKRHDPTIELQTGTPSVADLSSSYSPFMSLSKVRPIGTRSRRLARLEIVTVFCGGNNETMTGGSITCDLQDVSANTPSTSLNDLLDSLCGLDFL